MVAIFKNEPDCTFPVASFPRVCFQAKSVGTNSNYNTENYEHICATKLRPSICKLIILTKLTTSLRRPEFNQQFYNLHSLSTEIQVDPETKVELGLESEIDSKIEPPVKLKVELKVKSDVKLENE